MSDDELTRKDAEMGRLTFDEAIAMSILHGEELTQAQRDRAASLIASALRKSLESVREEALEEAAKVCDAHIFQGTQVDDQWLDGANTACVRLAFAIRALQSPARVAEGEKERK